MELRKHILNPPRAPSYIDGVAHWKGRFEQSQIEIHQLQTKVTSLTRENVELQSNNATGRKRKSVAPTAASRRVRRQTSNSAAGSDNVHCMDLDHDLASVESDAILFHLFAVQEAMTKVPIRPTVVVAQLIEALQPIIQGFRGFLKPSESSSGEDFETETGLDVKDDIAELTALTRATGLVMHYLAELSKVEGHLKAIGPLVYSCTTLYQTLLDVIMSATAKSQSKSKRSSKQKGTGMVKPKLLDTTAKLFLDLIDLWDTSSAGNFQLFEAVLYLVTERVGALVYIFNFSHEQPATIFEELEMDQLHHDPNFGEPTIRENALFEAKYIHPIFKRLLILAPHFYQAKANHFPASAKPANTPGKKLTLSRLPLDAKMKLQETLVKCIWNEERGHGQIMECLSKPVLKGNLPTLPRGHGENKNWFLDEVWKLVGWDVLKKRDY